MRVRQRSVRRAVLSGDTAAAIEQRQIALWREMTASAKLSSAANASVAVAELALAGIRQREPSATPDESFVNLARLRLGPELARVCPPMARRTAFPGAAMDPLDVTWRVATTLEACGVRYVLGGSLASSVSGEPRSTLDVGLMIDLTIAAIPCLVAGFGEDFYVDAEALARAVRERSSVNIIHVSSATKVDLFIMGATAIEPGQMERRRQIEIGTPPRGSIYVYTAEDILLQKLRWFRLGGEASDRQWRDVLGIVAVQGERLDGGYLREAASAIDVLDLLERALRENRGSPSI